MPRLWGCLGEGGGNLGGRNLLAEVQVGPSHVSSPITFLDTHNFRSTKHTDISEAPKLELKCTRKNTRRKRELVHLGKRNNCPTYFPNHYNCSNWRFSSWSPAIALERKKVWLLEEMHSFLHTYGYSPLIPPHQCQSHEHNFCLLQEPLTLGRHHPPPTNANEEVTTGHPFLEQSCPQSQVENSTPTGRNLSKLAKRRGKKSPNVGSREGQL